MDLSKKQKRTIVDVGKACDPKSEKIMCAHVFSDGDTVFGTNGHLMFFERVTDVPKAAFYPKDATAADDDIRVVGFEADDFLKIFHDGVKFHLKDDETSYDYLRAAMAYDKDYKKELFQIIFSNDGHFQNKHFYLRRLLKKAAAFVGKEFCFYTKGTSGIGIVESKDGKRCAIFMPILRTEGIVVQNFNVDLKGILKCDFSCISRTDRV